jgi:hypothetical protein
VNDPNPVFLNDVFTFENPNDPSTPNNEPFTVMWMVNVIGRLDPSRSLSIAVGDLDNDGDADIVTGDAWIGVNNITVWTNNLTEGTIPWMDPWPYEKYPLFTGVITGGINALALGDLDVKKNQGNNKAGDLDILHLVINTPHLWVKENIGAQLTELVTPVSTPPAPPFYNINNGATEDLMAIDVIHNGVSWDNDSELATWHFLFDTNGALMTDTQIDNLILNFYVYRDVDGNDIWNAADAGGDTGASSAIGPGMVTMTFPESSGNLNVMIRADTNETYFFVVELEGNASMQTPNTFNVTFEPDGYRPGEWNEVEHEDEDTILTVQDAIPTRAGVFRAVGGLVDNEPPQITDVAINNSPTVIYALCTTPPPPTINLTAVVNDTLTGGSNITGANYTIGFQNWSSSQPMNPTDGNYNSNVSESVNLTIDITGLGPGTYEFYVYGWDNASNYNTTGAFATLIIQDDCPPEIGPVAIDGANTATYSVCTVTTIDLTSTVNDTGLGDSDIGGANYTIGPQNWLGTSMNPSDGTFDNPVEDVNITINVSTWQKGVYELYVYGWDVIPNNNTTSVQFAILTLVDDCPPLVQNVLLNGQPTLPVVAGTLVWVNATLDDTTTGNSNISSANYTKGIQNWSSAQPMNAIIPPFDDNPVEDVTNDPTPINTASWSGGAYNICVYGSDELGNNNTTGSCAILTIASELIPPEIYNVWIDGSPTQSYGLSSLPPTFYLNATIDDEATGASFIGNVTLGGANYTFGPDNWPSSQPMNAVDTTWEDNIAENVTVTNSTPTAPGIYEYCVYGWDQWFNYNTTGACATLTIVDDLPPEIDNVRINGSLVHVVTVGTPSVDLTAFLNETNTGQSNIGGANYTIDPQNWSSSDNMFPTDGFWNEIMEDANKTIDISSWSPGIYYLCVYGWDSEIPQNNNVTGSCAELRISAAVDLPPEIFNVRINGSTIHVVTVGTPSVNLTAFLDETNTGLSNIGGANYTVGVQMWGTSVNMDPLDGGWDEISEDAWKIIDISAWPAAPYLICVYGWDSAIPPNNNVTGPCAQLTINPAVDTPPTIDVWEPGGTLWQEYTQGDMINVTWATNDDNPLPVDPINITYGDSVSGWTNISLNQTDDGVYSWDTSDVTCPGTYQMNLTVYDSIGQKAYDLGNYTFNITCPPQLTDPPVIVSVDTDPDSPIVGQTVTITVVVSDDDTPLDTLTVKVEIKNPNGDVLGNYTMQHQGSGTFTYSSSFDLEGTYTFTVWAIDPDNNADSEPGSFTMNPESPPPAEEYNWKPVVALAFAMILLFLGLLAAFMRPIGFKGILQRDRLLTFLGGVLPFVIAEAATGVVSLATGALSIPPLMGEGLVVDVVILVIGILIILAILMKGKPAATYGAQPPAPEPGEYQPPPPPPEGMGPGMADQETPLPPPPPEEGSFPPEPEPDTGVPPPPPPS